MKNNGLDEKKSKLIEEFMSLSKGKKNDEILPLVLAVSTKAKKENISFEKDDIAIIVNNLKANMNEKERARLDKILELVLTM